jgi:hypothetical protein
MVMRSLSYCRWHEADSSYSCNLIIFTRKFDFQPDLTQGSNSLFSHDCNHYQYELLVYVRLLSFNRYLSQWKQVVEAYSAIRARLLYSQDVLDDTDLSLPYINETTLNLWYNQTKRIDEVRTLLQGLEVPQPPLVAIERLLPAKERVPDVAEPPEPHQFVDPSDKRGVAHVRKAASEVYATTSAVLASSENEAMSSVTSAASASAGNQPVQDCPVPAKMSRTTAWRQRKRETENQAKPQVQEQGQSSRPRTYLCRVCGKPMASAGHTQFSGQRYCPEAPGIPPKDQWLQQKREEKAAKKRSQQTE